MATLQQRIGQIITRARVRQGIRADISNDTSAKFGEALTALRAELGDDALLEWVLRTTIQEIDGMSEDQAEAERSQRRRFPVLNYDDDEKLARPAVPTSHFFE